MSERGPCCGECCTGECGNLPDLIMAERDLEELKSIYHSAVAALERCANERHEARAALARVRAALHRLERHHNTEDCGWRGGAEEACPVAAEARAALEGR